MCKTTVTYLPRCTPTPANTDHHTQSAALLENLGALESWKGNLEKSSAYLDEAMRLYHQEGDKKGICSVLQKQAAATLRAADYVKLRAVASTALEHCQALNDTVGIAETSYYLGYSIMMLDNWNTALPLLQKSLEIRRAHGDEVGVVQCLETIGTILSWKGEMQESRSNLEEAVAIATRSGDQLGHASALKAIALMHMELDDVVKAADAFSEAIAISRSVGSYVDLPLNLALLGGLKIRSEDYQEAERHFQESVSTARRTGSQWLAYGLWNLGLYYWVQSKLNEAVSALEESFQLYVQQSRPGELKELASTLVDVKRRQGDWDGTLFWHDRIIAVCRDQKEHSNVADHLEKKGAILVERRRYDEAALHFEASMLARMENGDSWSLEQRQTREKLCAIPKTVMKWERRLPLLCDVRKLQRRHPQLVTAHLKLPIPVGQAEL